MADPWNWCVSVFEKHDIDSKMVSEAVGSPRSTMRSLFNGTNAQPRYALLCSCLRYCIDIENGQGFATAAERANAGRKADKSAKAEAKKVAPKQPTEEYDFL
jgi:hypothetical protein